MWVCCGAGGVAIRPRGEGDGARCWIKSGMSVRKEEEKKKHEGRECAYQNLRSQDRITGFV